VRIAKAAASLGVTKIKVTGGEPLVRKGVSHLIWALKNIGGIQTVTLTSNGVLFSEFGRQLADAGLDGVNFSIDSLNPQAYFQITRRDALDGALRAVSLALEYGLTTKINCVPILEYASDVAAWRSSPSGIPSPYALSSLCPSAWARSLHPF
jgi:cyclic pyranopterin phosphate synthase